MNKSVIIKPLGCNAILYLLITLVT